MASMGPRCERVPLMARTFVRWRAVGLGRAGERVEKTPVRTFAASPEMNLQDISARQVQPRQNDDFMADEAKRFYQLGLE